MLGSPWRWEFWQPSSPASTPRGALRGCSLPGTSRRFRSYQSMDIQPILAAMRRNKFGAVLICIQMAVTIAVLCNAVFVIQQRIAWTEAPTGLDEQNIFTIKNKWIGHPEQAPLTRTKA